MTSRSEVAWSHLASAWDTSGAAWNKPVASRLVELAGLRPGMHVLDAGCGAGAATIPAALTVAPGGRVTGIDSAAAMIVRARREADHAGLTNTEFWCEDAASPSLRPCSLEAVISSMVVAYLPSPATALHAWRELLRPAGVLAWSWVQGQEKEWQAAYDAVDAFLAPEDQWSAQRRRWTVAEAESLLPPGMKVTTVTEPVTTRYESADHWWESQWTQAPAVAWGHIPSEFRGSARKAASDKLAGLASRDGSLERTRAVCYTIARL
jgi:O-methyltransferase/aklanonic acid methyltransferase